MKFLSSQLVYLLGDKQARRDLAALGRYLAFLGALVVVFAVLFHVIMLHYEGQRHSWITGFYWTFTVMTTLGFGDITFASDVGRAFSIVVLVSGVLFLLVVLPFMFIRYFYAPWLEAQIRVRAPRELPETESGHVVLCHWDAIAAGLVKRLREQGAKYCVIEPDPAKAAELHGDGVRVLAGEVDARETYAKIRADAASLVVANLDDASNTNIALTVREISKDVPIVALAEDRDSVDILELAGAGHVIALKHMLGEQLAHRVASGSVHSHVIGRYESLRLAEFPVHHTEIVGKRLREAGLRTRAGVTVVARWERGRLAPAGPDVVIDPHDVLVVAGTEEQIRALDSLYTIAEEAPHVVVVIGGGKVGRSAARALRRRNIPVHLVEKEQPLAPLLDAVADHVVIGDAADREVLMRAGLGEASSVIISTNSDANNIYLTLYCRRLNPELRIISRITHERNLEAVHRAGADFVLSYTWLGVRAILSAREAREVIVLGEGVDLYFEPTARSLVGKTLVQSRIGERTGLSVVAIQTQAGLVVSPAPTHALEAQTELVVIGTEEQQKRFRREFGGA